MRAMAEATGLPPVTGGDDDDVRRTVVVVGGGITGLTAAHALRRRGVHVTLYEAAPQVGGAMRTTHAGGFLAEHGPNSILCTPAAEQLIAQLGIDDEVIEVSAAAQHRYVVRGGVARAFPISPLAMLSTPLLSWPAKLRVLMEPLVRRRRTQADESIASFIERRLGREVLDYAVDPFVAGIYAGDPDALSMAHAFPQVFDLERQYGSLSKGLMATRREAQAARKAAAPAALPSAPSRAGRIIAFLDGMQTLPDALGAALGDAVRTDCPVRLVHRHQSRWMVEAGAEGAPHARLVDAVVMATPAHVLAAMELPAALRRDAAPIEQVAYPPVSTLTIGFRRGDVAHPLDGFGMLVPRVERRSVLGVLFNSTLFPERAPEGHVTLTCFVGGARQPERAREATDVLVERVLHDLRELLGVRGEPVFASHVYWPRAIPQYGVGYQAVKDAADATERQNPGLYLAGNYRTGVSVGDCIVGGLGVADRVAEYLARAG
ncbi:MAG: protoporphyrinogen oxidase [Gemmatimonadetes bacterium]|nr:protoporphyrinogen oxidase [Gemmatimonadota bacterium]